MKTLRLLRLLVQLLALAGGVLAGETAVDLLARGCAGPAPVGHLTGMAGR